MKNSETLAKRDFLSIREAAEMIGVSTKTIYKKIKQGKISLHRFAGINRISKADIINS